MEDSGRVEYGRRDFLRYAALAAASIAAGGVAALAFDAKEFARQREQLFGHAPWYARFFGKDPILVDGELEQLKYDLYLKDKSRFRVVAIDALEFLRGKHQETYKQVFGSEWHQHWRKDRKKVIVALLRSINVPIYDLHIEMRNALKGDGVLNFSWHQEEIQKGLDELVNIENKYVKGERARQMFRSQFIGRVPKAAEGLKRLYIATLPVYDPKGRADFEKEAADIADVARDAFDNAQNLADGLKSNDGVKSAHQTVELIRKFDTIFTDLGSMVDKSILYRTGVEQQQHGAKLTHKISVSRDGADNALIWVYEELYDEYEKEYKFESWVQSIQQRVAELMQAPAKR